MKYADFAPDNSCELAFLPLLGYHSVLLAYGRHWERKHAMLRLSFSKSNILTMVSMSSMSRPFR
jgi:hypothetical protein